MLKTQIYTGFTALHWWKTSTSSRTDGWGRTKYNPHTWELSRRERCLSHTMLPCKDGQNPDSKPIVIYLFYTYIYSMLLCVAAWLVYTMSPTPEPSLMWKKYVYNLQSLLLPRMVGGGCSPDVLPFILVIGASFLLTSLKIVVLGCHSLNASLRLRNSPSNNRWTEGSAMRSRRDHGICAYVDQ